MEGKSRVPTLLLLPAWVSPTFHWGLLGKQPPYKVQVAFSSLDYCLCGRCGSLKGLVSEHRISVPLVEWRGPRTEETCLLLTMTVVPFVFQRKLSKGANQFSWALGRWAFGKWLWKQESAHGASQLFAPKDCQLSLHFLLLRAKSMYALSSSWLYPAL